MSARDRALVVLGCTLGPTGIVPGSGAERRVYAAGEAWAAAHANPPTYVIVSGGRVWHGRTEADVMAQALIERGVPNEVIVRERLSFSTRENARYVAVQCANRGIDRVALVTCVWHLPRALQCFAAEGLAVVEQISAGERPAGWLGRAWIRGRERALALTVSR